MIQENPMNDPQVTRDRRPAKSPVEKHAKSEKFPNEM
jgi:hypothetical protein